MLYSPTVLSNQWVTATTSANGNGGIDNQRKFKEGVMMLEKAISDYSNPLLLHLVLTHSTDNTYTSFISRLCRALKAKGIHTEYKACTELDSFKGQHVHIMLVVDTDTPGTVLEVVDKITVSVNATQPEFRVEVCEAHRHGNQPYIALSIWTLQDAADWLSYIYKARSKLEGHRYMSSRVKGVSIGKG